MTRGNVRHRFCGSGYTLRLVRWLTDEEALALFNDEPEALEKFQWTSTTRLANATVKQCANVTLERETFGRDGRTRIHVELGRRDLDCGR